MFSLGDSDVYAKIIEQNYSSNISIYKYVDQERFLSKSSIFITHGGAGSIYEAIKNTVPMICFPQMGEQNYNASRLENLGMGYNFGIVDKVDTYILTQIINRLIQDKDKYLKNLISMRNTFDKSVDNKQVLEFLLKIR